jgi:hypothetical protein
MNCCCNNQLDTLFFLRLLIYHTSTYSKLTVSGPLTVNLEVSFAICIQPPDDGLLIRLKHVEVC